MLVPAVIGTLMKQHPDALGWAELSFVMLQLFSYFAVATMPIWTDNTTDASSGGIAELRPSAANGKAAAEAALGVGGAAQKGLV
jgi:hypothetical protein